MASPRAGSVAGQLRRVLALQTSAPAPTPASLSIPWRGTVNLLPRPQTLPAQDSRRERFNLSRPWRQQVVLKGPAGPSASASSSSSSFPFIISMHGRVGLGGHRDGAACLVALAGVNDQRYMLSYTAIGITLLFICSPCHLLVTSSD